MTPIKGRLQFIDNTLSKRRVVVTVSLFFFFNIVWTPAFAQLEQVESYFKNLENIINDEPITVQFIDQNSNLVEDFSRLNQIVLLRHGEPALDKKGWRKRKEAMRFVKQYDSVGVYPPQHLPLKLRSGEIDTIFTSTLNRSISTAQQLFPEYENRIPKSIFREFERKVFSFFNIKLPLKWWTTGSRFFWVIGFNKKGIESFSEAKQRAKKATNLLEDHASQNGKTLLVSHGLLNHYLVKYLKKNGWTEVFDGGKGYLSQKLLVKYE